MLIKNLVEKKIEELKEEVEKITHGKVFISLDELEEIELLECVYLENCGLSGSGQGLLYVLYLVDEYGDKTDYEIFEFILKN